MGDIGGSHIRYNRAEDPFLFEPQAPWHAEVYLVGDIFTYTDVDGIKYRYRVVDRKPKRSEVELWIEPA